MNKKLLAFALLAFAAPVVAQSDMGAMQMPEGHDVTITGHVIDISCKFGLGLSGDSHRMCAQVCGDQGLPLAILSDDGKLFIPTTADMPGSSQNDTLKPFAEQKVTVTGKSFKAGGAQAIHIASIKAAK
jgi:hypothetical protein